VTGGYANMSKELYDGVQWSSRSTMLPRSMVTCPSRRNKTGEAEAEGRKGRLRAIESGDDEGCVEDRRWCTSPCFCCFIHHAHVRLTQREASRCPCRMSRICQESDAAQDAQSPDP
jgi:hypothetical protein